MITIPDILNEIADCIDSGSAEGIRHLAYQLEHGEEIKELNKDKNTDNPKYELYQDDKGEWYIMDNEDCYCAAGPFVDGFTASLEKIRLENLNGQSN